MYLEEGRRPDEHGHVCHIGGVYQRPDDWAYTGIPGQEDRRAGDETGGGLPYHSSLLILGFSALAVSTAGGLEGITNPGFHGLSQVLYEYSSSAANNGSGFEGLADNSVSGT